MSYKKIDIGKLLRKEHFIHYTQNVPCSYAITADIDIDTLVKTLKVRKIKLYPALIYILSSLINHHEEFRMAFDDNGELILWDSMHPSFTVLNKETDTFSSLWCEYSDNFNVFYKNYLDTVERFSHTTHFTPQSDCPANTFPISSIPWVSFTGFNLNLPKSENYLTPIFTFGKYYIKDGRAVIPVSMQVHHSAADGFHTARFLNEITKMSDSCENWL